MHPTSEKLIETLDGRGEAVIRRHLESCPECAERLLGVRALIDTMRTDRDTDPPAEWVARVVALRTVRPLDAVREKVAAWIGGLREEISRVVSDSGSIPGEFALAGVRSAGSSRRLRFEAGSVELDLQIEPEIGGAVVTGQFVSSEGEPAPIRNAPFLVAVGGDEPLEGITDRLGEFSIDAPEGAVLQLRLRYDDRIVRFDVPPEPTSEP